MDGHRTGNPSRGNKDIGGQTMAKGLEEYAREHPQQEPAAEKESREQYIKDQTTRQRDRAEVDRLKESITAQLEQGNDPQYILYAAIKAIGILTHDAGWTDRAQSMLNDVYDDLRQQSFLVDNAAIAAHRLEGIKEQYNSRLKKQLQTQLNGYRRVERALNEALQAVNEIEQ